MTSPLLARALEKVLMMTILSSVKPSFSMNQYACLMHSLFSWCQPPSLNTHSSGSLTYPSLSQPCSFIGIQPLRRYLPISSYWLWYLHHLCSLLMHTVPMDSRALPMPGCGPRCWSLRGLSSMRIRCFSQMSPMSIYSAGKVGSWLYW